MNHIRQFPHCDPKILHKPGECTYCDSHPDWQELREVWGIAFTGHSHERIEEIDWKGKKFTKVLIPCPSEQDRPLEVINKWGGNRPAPSILEIVGREGPI